MPSLPQLLIDLKAAQANYRILAARAGAARTAAVVKADGYGLGAAPLAKALFDAGCRIFFTAHFSEALSLRPSLPKAVIAPFHGLTEGEYGEALAHHITPVLNSLGDIETAARHAGKRGLKCPAFVHLDTGMNRLGLPEDEAERLILEPDRLNSLDLAAFMSHLACAEEAAHPMNATQRDKFKNLLARLPKAPASLCNSSGLFLDPSYHFDLARPGLAIYGANPTPLRSNPMHAVAEARAPILQIRDVDTPMTVGYGATHRLVRKGRIATLALGYADGYFRNLSGQGQVKIGNFLAPVVGRISMDLTTVDVTELPGAIAHVGAWATVIGPHRSIDTVAKEAGTIAYEILTSFGARYQRCYH